MDKSLPIFLQVSLFIENEILSGKLEAHDRVPSTNELASFMKINPATAGRGLGLLVDEGILYKRRGMGMYVTDDGREIIKKKRKEDFLKKNIPSLIKEVKALDIELGELIKIIEENYHA